MAERLSASAGRSRRKRCAVSHHTFPVGIKEASSPQKCLRDTKTLQSNVRGYLLLFDKIVLGLLYLERGRKCIPYNICITILVNSKVYVVEVLWQSCEECGVVAKRSE